MAVCSKESAVCALPAFKSQLVSRSLQGPEGYCSPSASVCLLCHGPPCQTSCDLLRKSQHNTEQQLAWMLMPVVWDDLNLSLSTIVHSIGASAVSAAPSKSLIKCQTGSAQSRPLHALLHI